MRIERRAILALMAAGRISAADAERLLRAWNDRFEGYWIGVLCVSVCLVQFHTHISLDGLTHFVHGLLREGWHAWGATASSLTKGTGGTI